MYLFESYERLEKHLLTKKKNFADKVTELKTIIARYFVTCLSCPDSFDLKNEEEKYQDFSMDGAGGGMMNMMGGMNEDMRMAYVMNDGGMNPGQMNAENLQSGQQFTFTDMQTKIWEAAKKTAFIHHREFMTTMISEMTDDPDTRNTFYITLFEKLHL